MGRTTSPQLMVVTASTRPGRSGLPITRWLVEQADAHGAFNVEVVDLAELALPFLDEPKHPRLRRYEHEHTRRWSAMVDATEAFVFVTAEYNHGYPAPLKNAIDYLHAEWRDKPVGFVSYGGVAAGTRAVQQLKQVVTALKMLPVSNAVYLPFHAKHIDERGHFHTTEPMRQAAKLMLDEIGRIQQALRTLREDREPS